MCYNGLAPCKLCSAKYKFDTIKQFVEWLKAEGNKHFIWYAHNSGSYDSQFILKEIYKNTLPTDPELKIIPNGTKILELRFKSFKVRDSASFLPMPLAQFSKAFDIKELKKG